MFIFKNKIIISLLSFCFITLFVVLFIFLNRQNVAVYSPIYEVETDKNEVAICINVDWGEEYLGDMLCILKAEDAKATFFVTGRWVEAQPEAALSIKKAGMEIGNHGLKHKSPNGMTYEENCKDIQAAEKIINDKLHIKTVLFAPAAGECEEKVLKAAEDCGYQTILWSVDTIDWQKPDAKVITERVSGKVKSGSVILMHPTENTVEALPSILEDLKSKKFQTIFVSELIDNGD